MPLTSWYDHLDEVAEDLAALRDAATPGYPEGQIEVTPAPPEPKDILRMSKRMLTQTFISASGFDEGSLASGSEGALRCVAHVYTRDGQTAQQGEVIERNRLAAIMCEQLHVTLRDMAQYQIDAPSGRDWQMGRGENLRTRNLSFANSMDGKSPDDYNLAHWVVQWEAAMRNEPMVSPVFVDLTRIDVDVIGDELGGDAPDTGDDQETRVTFP